MKKILAAILSLSLCGVMLAACGNDSGTNTGATTDSQTSAAADDGADANDEQSSEETGSEAETETESEADAEAENDEEDSDPAGVSVSSYDNVDVFAKDSGIFSLPTETVTAADSLTYGFVKTLEGATEFYMDVEATDGSMTMVMAMSESSVYMKMSGSSAEENITIMIKDSMMYMLDDSTKSGYYFAADEETMSQYNVEEMLSEIDMDKEIEEAEDVKVCKVEIGGKEYTFEVAETGGGFLFDGDELYAIVSPDSGDEFNALIVHEFSGSVSSDVFELPSDYELIDLSEAMAQQQ